MKTNEKGNEELSLKSQEIKTFSNSSIIDLKVTEMAGEEVIIVAHRGEQIAVYYTDTGVYFSITFPGQAHRFCFTFKF